MFDNIGRTPFWMSLQSRILFLCFPMKQYRSLDNNRIFDGPERIFPFETLLRVSDTAGLDNGKLNNSCLKMLLLWDF